MRNQGKKIISGVIAATLLFATVSLAGCDKDFYTQDALAGYQSSTNKAVSNGGFAVEKDDYVYFINGEETYSASNEFGQVQKGALMRVKKSELAGDVSALSGKAETVVPMLFVAQNFNSGIYIYGDYVYFATPTTDKNMSGEVENTWIDFKRAKLDGSETMKGYYFRLSSNSANYRFVEENDVVYCLYEEDGALKSYNTSTDSTTVLVSGTNLSFIYDQTDLTNPNVYYTMSVTTGIDTDHSATAAYNQVYCVNAAATVESVNSENASYTVKGGKTYDFDEQFLKEKNAEAKENKQDEPYDLGDYTTYPYVNLGTLVLDGVGLNSTKTQFNQSSTAPATPDGYEYAISSYANGGIYFTRTEVVKTSSDAESTKLYYVASADSANSGYDSVSANGSVVEIAPDTTNTTSAIFYKTQSGAHEYLYTANSALYRATAPDANGNVKTVRLAKDLTDITLWKVEENYLYYYAATENGNGNNLSRIDYTGAEENYHILINNETYAPQTLAFVDWNSSWYKPEIFGDTVLYSNAQSFGSLSYNYIYAAKLTDIKAQNEKYQAVQDYIEEYSENSDLQAAMKYYFRTGKTEAFEAVKGLYDSYQQDEFAKFAADTTLAEESAFIGLVSSMTDADKNAIETAWVNSLRAETQNATEDKGLETWAIVLICVGGALVVAAAVLIPLLVIGAKKKAQAREAEATVNAYKRKKIDTTDDKSIDVYADEETVEETTENAVETSEEQAEAQPQIEEVVEETESVVEGETEAQTATEEPAQTEAEKQE